MDALSDVLRTIRLEGASFVHGEFREPWSLQVPTAASLTRNPLDSGAQVAVIHVVLEGRCWSRLTPHGEPIPLKAGDVIVYPHGDPHQLGSGLNVATVSIHELVQASWPDSSGLRYGGDGDRAVLVCGWLATERDWSNPMLSALPPVFTTSIGERPSGPWLEHSIRFALRMGSAERPGSGVIAAKVAEALFVEALRGYIETLPEMQPGWLSGLRDPQVGRCLALLHAEPARRWTIDDLARRVRSSRSVLAQRFTELVGVPPIQYLTRFRLALATRLLGDEQRSIARVAESVGYESETAFNRAFKREYGMSPGRFRRERARRLRAQDEGHVTVMPDDPHPHSLATSEVRAQSASAPPR